MFDEISHESAQHDAFMFGQQDRFVGRKQLTKNCLNKLREMTSGILMLYGKAGTGKSAFVVSYSFLSGTSHIIQGRVYIKKIINFIKIVIFYLK